MSAAQLRAAADFSPPLTTDYFTFLAWAKAAELGTLGDVTRIRDRWEDSMGLLDGLLGNATSVETADVERELVRILVPGEAVHRAYRVMRDMFIFTSSRLILVDKQGVTGKKVSYVSVPYKSIRMFAVETAGTFDLDAELKIWVAGLSAPIERQFRRGEAIFDVQTTLAHYVNGA